MKTSSLFLLCGFFGTLSIGQTIPMNPIEFAAMWFSVTAIVAQVIIGLVLVTVPGDRDPEQR